MRSLVTEIFAPQTILLTWLSIKALAPKHFDTRFLRINVDNAPFLVTKLKIQILPCVIAFVDGVIAERIIGFEGLGRGDSFTVRELEMRLLRSGVLVRAKTGKDEDRVGNLRKTTAGSDANDDNDDDWD